MPGTAHGVADQQSVGKRCAVVRTDGADREELVSTAHEQHRFAERVPENHRAVGDRRDSDSLRQVRPGERVVHAISSVEG